MKALLKNIALMAVTLLLAALPATAREGVMVKEPQVHKSECLLVAKNCPTDSIQDRINRIQAEINKGTAVYTQDELRRLNQQLKEAEGTLNYELTNSGAAGAAI